MTCGVSDIIRYRRKRDVWGLGLGARGPALAGFAQDTQTGTDRHGPTRARSGWSCRGTGGSDIIRYNRIQPRMHTDEHGWGWGRRTAREMILSDTGDTMREMGWRGWYTPRVFRPCLKKHRAPLAKNKKSKNRLRPADGTTARQVRRRSPSGTRQVRLRQGFGATSLGAVPRFMFIVSHL